MDLTKNKENAIAFYKTAFEGNPEKAVKLYVGSMYIQHNPAVEDGPEGFVKYFNKMHKDYPAKSVSFLRSIAEGNLVALHTRQEWPGNEAYVTMDFFRFDDNGKIVEHWDAIQEVPEGMAHENGMY